MCYLCFCKCILYVETYKNVETTENMFWTASGKPTNIHSVKVGVMLKEKSDFFEIT